MTVPTFLAAKPGKLRIGLLIFTALQVLDFLTTVGVFSRGGYEANPLIRMLMPWTGGPVAALLLVKVGLVLLTWRLSRRPWIVYCGNVLYGFVVIWNAALFFSTYR